MDTIRLYEQRFGPSKRMSKTLRVQSTNSSGSNIIVKFLGAVIIVLPAVFVGIVNLHVTYDDAFITYRYAYNLAVGNGFVYNPGEWFMGTTAPLYGLLLGCLGAVINSEAIPLLSGFISWLSLILTGVALYEYGWLHRQPLYGLLAGLFYVANPLVAMTFGGEILFQVMLIAWAFVLYKMDRTISATLLLALAILTRPDGVIAAGVIGVHYLFVHRRLPLREMVCMAIALLPFILLAWIFYGSPLPGTLQAKLAQGNSGLWQLFGRGTFEWLRGFTIQGSSPLFPGLLAVPNSMRFILFVGAGIPATFLFFRFQLLPLAWVALFALGYYFLRLPFYHWYVVPIILGLMILAAAGVASVVELIRKAYYFLRGSSDSLQIAGLLAVLCPLVLSPGIYSQLVYIQNRAAGQPHPGDRLYETTGRWLAANTLPGDRVGYFEIGIIGYYSRRTVIDALGLVTPGAAPHVANRDFLWAYAHYRPEYIIHNKLGPVAKLTEEEWFKQEYDEVASISQPGYPSPLAIYKRR